MEKQTRINAFSHDEKALIKRQCQRMGLRRPLFYHEAIVTYCLEKEKEKELKKETV